MRATVKGTLGLIRWAGMIGLALWAVSLLIFFGLNPASKVATRVEPTETDTVGYPGEEVTIWGRVFFDRTKKCDRETDREVVDSRGVIHRLLPDMVPRDQRDRMLAQKENPYLAPFSFVIPPSAAAGEANYVANTRYYCEPFHFIWPARYSWNQRFIILSKGVSPS